MDVNQSPIPTRVIPGQDQVTVRRILPDTPFREIGLPRIAVESPDGDLIAVGGTLGRPMWQACGMDRRSDRTVGWEPIGVYRVADLRLIQLRTSRWPVNALAFHPNLPFLAIGTGCYDGGYAYEGELLLLDLRTGNLVSTLEYRIMVEALTWVDPSTLNVVFAPLDDGGNAEPAPQSVRVALTRDDWDAPKPKMISWSTMGFAGATQVPRHCQPDPAAATATITALCAQWAPRQSVWAIEPLPDGRVLAALDGTTLECWQADTPELAWSIPAVEGRGCQISLHPSGQTVLTNSMSLSHYPPVPSLIRQVSLADGTASITVKLDYPAVLITRTDGWTALRDTNYSARKTCPITLLDPALTVRGHVPVSGYDLLNHYFPIRNAPALLLLVGKPSRPSTDKWIATIEHTQSDSTFIIRKLFALEWDPQQDRHLFGGPGVFLRDHHGPAIIHATTIHDGAGLLAGNALIVRRDYPTGNLRWEHHLDTQITALDSNDTQIIATTNLGEVLILNAADGTLLHHQRLLVNGHPVVPLCMRIVKPDRAWIGTHDGRILKLELPHHQETH